MTKAVYDNPRFPPSTMLNRREPIEADRIRPMCDDCIRNKHEACQGRCACICWRDRMLKKELHGA